MTGTLPTSPANLSLLSLGKGKGLPALTPAKGRAMAEAASVCFDIKKHPSPTPMTVAGAFSDRLSLRFYKVTQQMRLGNSDIQEATEDGACAVSFLLALHFTDYTVVERSWKSTGFDYSLGYYSDSLPFQRLARLEVSGICLAEHETVEGRVKAKKKQVDRSAGSGLPALIVVVDFRVSHSQVEWR